MKICALLLSLFIFASCSSSKENTLSSTEKSDNWQMLFNGKNMSQWRNFKAPNINKKWIIQAGAMTLVGKGGGDLITK